MAIPANQRYVPPARTPLFQGLHLLVDRYIIHQLGNVEIIRQNLKEALVWVIVSVPMLILVLALTPFLWEVLVGQWVGVDHSIGVSFFVAVMWVAASATIIVLNSGPELDYTALLGILLPKEDPFQKVSGGIFNLILHILQAQVLTAEIFILLPLGWLWWPVFLGYLGILIALMKLPVKDRLSYWRGCRTFHITYIVMVVVMGTFGWWALEYGAYLIDQGVRAIS